MVVIDHLLEFEPDMAMKTARRLSVSIEDMLAILAEDGFKASPEFELSFIKGIAHGVAASRIAVESVNAIPE